MTSKCLACPRGVVVLLALCCTSGPLRAASLYFSGAVGKTWDQATTADWSSTSGGPYGRIWSSGADAFFEGTAGTVTVSGTISSVNSLHFNVDGYTLNGGAITLAGSSGSISTGAGADTIASQLAGQHRLNKMGPGILSLTNALNSFAGPTVVSAGTLQVAAPVLPAGTRIMPVGDSITYGYGGTNAGYRGYLYTDLVTTGSTFQFVGTTNGNAASLPVTPVNQTYHDGWSGWTTGDINGTQQSSFNNGTSGNIGTWLTKLSGSGQSPTAILMMIGTNDPVRGGTGNGGTVSQGTANLSSVIDTEASEDRGVRILLATLTPRNDNSAYSTWVNNYNAALPGLVAQKLAAGDNIALVDMNTRFPVNGLSSDNLHPNEVGYAWMAAQWSAALLVPPTAMMSSAIPANSPTSVATGAGLSLGGGQAQVGPLSGGGSIALGTSGGLTINSTSGNNTTFSGSISGSGGVTKNGPAALTFSGTSTYGGPTLVNSGALLLGPGGSLGNTAVTVAAGAAFGTALPAGGGAATIGGMLKLSSGSTLDLASDLATNVLLAAGCTLSGATLEYDLSAGGSDTLVLQGPASVSGNNTIGITGIGSSLTPGNYTLISATSGLGNDFTLSSGTISVGGTVYDLGLINSATAEVLAVSAVPEPDTLALLAAATAVAGWAAWRRRRRA
ncbi:MAG: GDSL-type esterase/lipase family protein [Thermoguttaceae bacterium]